MIAYYAWYDNNSQNAIGPLSIYEAEYYFNRGITIKMCKDVFGKLIQLYTIHKWDEI